MLVCSKERAAAGRDPYANVRDNVSSIGAVGAWWLERSAVKERCRLNVRGHFLQAFCFEAAFSAGIVIKFLPPTLMREGVRRTRHIRYQRATTATDSAFQTRLSPRHR